MIMVIKHCSSTEQPDVILSLGKTLRCLKDRQSLKDQCCVWGKVDNLCFKHI